jgi:hypothetical protein
VDSQYHVQNNIVVCFLLSTKILLQVLRSNYNEAVDGTIVSVHLKEFKGSIPLALLLRDRW